MYIPPEAFKIQNQHMAKAHELFGDEPVGPGTSTDEKLLFICFTNRCGSNYLSEAIASSGALNRAGEYFNADTMENSARTRDLKSFDQYIRFLCKREGVSNRLCSKIAVTQFAMLDKYGVYDQVGRDPRFLFIERRDLLGQAISWQIASQTLRWRASDAGVASTHKLEFSSAAVSSTLDSIARQNYLWRLVFAKNKIPFFHIIYEDFIAEPLDTLGRIATWLGIDGSFDLGKVHVKQQRGQTNKEWLEAYSPLG